MQRAGMYGLPRTAKGTVLGISGTARKTAIALSLAAALGLSGCAPGSGSAAPAEAPTGPVATDPAKLGKVHLKVLDTFAGGVDAPWMKSVVAAFHRKYPNITIDRTSQPWGDVMQELPLKLKADDPPDIVPANNGWQSLGELVQGHLVLNLDRYADAYGWRKHIPESILRQHEFSTDGKKMGTGAMFGTPVARASLIEVYYNRHLMEKIGAKVPTTLAAFEKDLAKAKSAGITPIAMGNSDKAGMTEPLFSAMNSYGSQPKISNLVYSQGDVPLSEAGFPEAVDTVHDWSKKGYFTHDYQGTPMQDATQDFVDGKGLFIFNYSGSLPVTKEQGSDFGSFFLPRAHGGDPVATAGSTTNFSISAKSKHPDAAAAFLNFAAGHEAARLAVDHGTMPMLAPDLKAPKGNPMFADDVANAAEITAHDSSVPYLDWTTPTLLDTMSTRMQDMLAGRISPADVVDDVQEDVDGFRAKLK
ncbi:ABC transporter substrate-binding protein [Streptomyces odontomachi]|uniref:ABC transporter substrate-binding protein n=1 Tax=Streptomyces odontomachi TaxID=2944940 RepID=UPI00210E3630|nr:extracellular solute-binding protein [Streptomyces sp. ODS25]